MKKILVIVFGLSNFILFHLAIIGLYLFLNNDLFFDQYLIKDRAISFNFHSANAIINALILNTILIAFFTLPHSFLLATEGRNFTKKLNLPPKLHMTLYAFHASLSLMLMFYFWVPIGPFYEATGAFKIIIHVFQAASWLLMGWAMLATGPMRQIGMDHWWRYLKNEPVSYYIPYDGPFKYMRQPIYISFFGMILFSPHFSFSHLWLLIMWSTYLYWGARNKESRLMRNNQYREYAKNVSFIPFIMRN